jgi:hypothetical protein
LDACDDESDEYYQRKILDVSIANKLANVWDDTSRKQVAHCGNKVAASANQLNQQALPCN